MWRSGVHPHPPHTGFLCVALCVLELALLYRQLFASPYGVLGLKACSTAAWPVQLIVASLVGECCCCTVLFCPSLATDVNKYLSRFPDFIGFFNEVFKSWAFFFLLDCLCLSYWFVLVLQKYKSFVIFLVFLKNRMFCFQIFHLRDQ